MNKQERSSELLRLLQQARRAVQKESPELRRIEEHLARIISQKRSLKLFQVVRGKKPTLHDLAVVADLVRVVRTKSPTLHDLAVVADLVRVRLLTTTDFAVLLDSLELGKPSFQHNLVLVKSLISGRLSEEQLLEFIDHDDNIHEKRKFRQAGYFPESHKLSNDSSDDLIKDNPDLRFQSK